MPSQTLWEHSRGPSDLRFDNQSQRFGHSPYQTEDLYREIAAIFSTDSVKRLSTADRARFILYGVGPHYNHPLECVHHAFSEHARKRPEAIAVEHGRERISYQDLDRCSHELARKLRSRGVYPGQRVCLLVQRSIAMTVAILAILKAGASYVPLDGGIVTEKSLEFILDDSGAQFVLCLPAFRHRIPPHLEVISLENCIGPRDSHLLPIVDHSDGEHELYVIYTSGTTGQPKGVSISHRNVMNLLSIHPGKVGMRPGARVSQLLNVAFDMCAWETLGALVNGCTLCIRGKSAEDWETVLRSVDVVISTPTILQSYRAEDYPNVRFVATAGEPCPKALADSWSRTATFFNSCGPTETTIVNTMDAHQHGKAVSIGRPTPNNRVYILDQDRNPLPIGQVGIMWASGRGISSGYVNRPELNKERFVLDPFVKDGSFMFNTGDLGRWTADGQLEHHGRIDDQVKIKGFRVELDGVAAALQNHPGVTQAVALLVDDVLWGVFCPANLDITAIRGAAAESIPYYAVPTRFLPLDNLPSTGNGKVNKALLGELIRQVALCEVSKPRGDVTYTSQPVRSRFEPVLSRCTGLHSRVCT
ncbi:acetyl-CoA synthetase-like protein [Imleria badia]|nr:acetyl-CoA synthetase-like protein [Imleria badia]